MQNTQLSRKAREFRYIQLAASLESKISNGVYRAGDTIQYKLYVRDQGIETFVPAPGTGYWYVTAAIYQGERRYGRKANGGVLSGRNPGLLPVCQ